MTWPPGPPGSGMSRLNDPDHAEELRSIRAPGSLIKPPPGETGRGAPTSEAPVTGPGSVGTQPAPSEVTPRGPSAIAVLVPGGLRGIGGGAVADARNLAQVAWIARREGVRQVWVGPQTVALLGLQVADPPGTIHPWLGAALRDNWEVEPAGLAPWMELRYRGGGGGEVGRVELVFPGWDPDGNPFAGATSAGQLLDALELFARQLGLRYRWSPGATGLALMRAVHRGPGGVELPETGTPAPIAVQQRGALDSWASRSWIADELPADGWLHAWDVNGMYLAACSSAELGFGEPDHYKAPATQRIPVESFDGGRPGYWRAMIRAKRQAAGYIAPPFKIDGRARWYTTAAIEYLIQLDYQPRLLESWLYPQRRRWLEPWYERLRDARTALAATEGPAGPLALGAVKRVYTATLGRLAGSWLEVGDATFRPDWRHVVIDRARINLHRHLMRAHWGPTAMDEDLAVWHSSVADPVATAADLGLQVSDQLGKWKHVGAVQTAEAAARMAEAGSSTSKRLKALLAALEPSR